MFVLAVVERNTNTVTDKINKYSYFYAKSRSKPGFSFCKKIHTPTGFQNSILLHFATKNIAKQTIIDLFIAFDIFLKVFSEKI